MSGHIYIATNAGLRGLVKIGFTTQSPAKRIAQFSTGAPHPFVLAYCAPVASPRRIEQAVHAYLAPKRVNKGREFFAVTVEQAINVIHELSEEIRRRDELAAAEARYRNTLTAAKAALAAKENWRRGVLTNRKEMEALAALLALRDGLKIEALQLPRDKPVWREVAGWFAILTLFLLPWSWALPAGMWSALLGTIVAVYAWLVTWALAAGICLLGIVVVIYLGRAWCEFLGECRRARRSDGSAAKADT